MTVKNAIEFNEAHSATRRVVRVVVFNARSDEFECIKEFAMETDASRFAERRGLTPVDWDYLRAHRRRQGICALRPFKTTTYRDFINYNICNIK